MPIHRLTQVFILLCATLIASAGSAGSAPTPDARPATPPDPRVGALFLGNTPLHTCSGAVLDSRTRDLVITAAHCTVGPGMLIGFSPGYDKGASPHGVWSVSQVYLDPQWVSGHDPDHDYAILRVQPSWSAPRTTIEDAVGGGFHVSGNPKAGRTVTVSGYGVGLLDPQSTCTAPTGTDGRYATFACGGFVDGTSGGPWVADGHDLVGIIGGPHLGGCSDGVSYTPPFDSALTDVIRRAEDHSPADTAPVTNVLGDC